MEPVAIYVECQFCYWGEPHLIIIALQQRNNIIMHLRDSLSAGLLAKSLLILSHPSNA